MNKNYDSLIIGGGHNGLTTAALLAKAGQRVLVLEARGTLGGIAATEELFPGFHFNTGFSGAPMLRPEVVKDLALEKHGLEFIDSPTHIYAPNSNGESLTLWADTNKSVEAIAKHSAKDAERYPEFIGFVERMASVLSATMTLIPPSIPQLPGVAGLLPWAKVALKVKGLGERDMMEFMRILPMSAREFLDEWFESDLLKGALGMTAVKGILLGPMGAGTMLNLLYHLTGRRGPGQIKGGVGAISAALAKAAKSHGAEIRTETRVESILMENGKAIGVQTADGNQISASRVVSSIDPRATLFGLLGAEHLPVKVMRRVKNIRLRGSTATLHLALRKAPSFGVGLEQLGGHIVLNPSLEYLERAYDDAKYGRISENPALEISIPSLTDTALAPEDRHALSVTIRYAPYHLKEGNWAELESRVLDAIAIHAPDIREHILESCLITPKDYEEEYSLTEGAWMHGQMGLDQLMMNRPIPGMGEYAAPIEGLYLCGSGTHPGGGVTGAPGYNAARKILKDS